MILGIAFGIGITAWLITRWKFGPGVSWTGLLVMLQLVFQYIAVEYDLGPASLRIYNIAVLAVFSVIFALGSFQRSSTNERFGALLACGFGYVLWTLSCVLLRGEFGRQYLTTLFGVYFYGPVLCCCLVFLIRSRGELIGITGLLIFLGIINGIVGIGQWFENSFAWDLYRMIRPQSAFDRLAAEIETPEIGIGYVPGLQVNSIDLSYTMLFGALAFGYLLRDGIYHSRKWGVFWLAVCVVFLAGSVVALSRSSLLAFALIFGAGIFAARNSSSGQKVFLQKIAGYIAIITIITGATIWMIFSGEQGDTWTTARLTNLTDFQRLDLWRASLTAIADSPFVGVGINTYMRDYSDGQAPHSFLMSAGVYYGMTGLLFMLIFLALLATSTVRIWVTATAAVQKGEMAVSHIAIGSCLGVWAFIAKSFFHNNSFATGGIIGWMFIGLAVAAHRMLAVGRPSTPIHHVRRL